MQCSSSVQVRAEVISIKQQWRHGGEPPHFLFCVPR